MGKYLLSLCSPFLLPACFSRVLASVFPSLAFHLPLSLALSASSDSAVFHWVYNQPVNLITVGPAVFTPLLRRSDGRGGKKPNEKTSLSSSLWSLDRWFPPKTVKAPLLAGMSSCSSRECLNINVALSCFSPGHTGRNLRILTTFYSKVQSLKYLRFCHIKTLK